MYSNFKVLSFFNVKLFYSFLEEYENLYQEASSDVSKYLANPVNAFLLVKRLTADWKQVEGVMTQNTGPGLTKLLIFIVLLLIKRLS